MLLNLCFHMAMTSAVFVSITPPTTRMVCQAVSKGRAGVSRMGAISLGTEREAQAGSGVGHGLQLHGSESSLVLEGGGVRSRDTREQG